MDGPRDYHTKLNKSGRERQISYDITNMWNLKNGTNELIYKTNRIKVVKNKLMVTGGKGAVRDKLGYWD